MTPSALPAGEKLDLIRYLGTGQIASQPAEAAGTKAARGWAPNLTADAHGVSGAVRCAASHQNTFDVTAVRGTEQDLVRSISRGHDVNIETEGPKGPDAL